MPKRTKPKEIAERAAPAPFANVVLRRAPKAALEQRDRERADTTPLTPNQLILGDPIPGRSALDKRKG